jgi:hypothetical protein
LRERGIRGIITVKDEQLETGTLKAKRCRQDQFSAHGGTRLPERKGTSTWPSKTTLTVMVTHECEEIHGKMRKRREQH